MPSFREAWFNKRVRRDFVWRFRHDGLNNEVAGNFASFLTLFSHINSDLARMKRMRRFRSYYEFLRTLTSCANKQRCQICISDELLDRFTGVSMSSKAWWPTFETENSCPIGIRAIQGQSTTGGNPDRVDADPPTRIYLKHLRDGGKIKYVSQATYCGLDGTNLESITAIGLLCGDLEGKSRRNRVYLHVRFARTPPSGILQRRITGTDCLGQRRRGSLSSSPFMRCHPKVRCRYDHRLQSGSRAELIHCHRLLPSQRHAPRVHRCCFLPQN